jgi:hypothetical protein
MPGRTITCLLLAVVLLACGADGKEKTADKDKTADKKDASKKDEKPACMHCGATCGLVPVCVCEPGTKKKPKVEFDVTCEPICVAGCGSKPWPFGRCHDRAGCTSCCAEPCRCPGWVRNCKKLKKETTDEDVPTIKRKVAYVCDCCAGRCKSGCCGGGRARRSPNWWACLISWMTYESSP